MGFRLRNRVTRPERGRTWATLPVVDRPHAREHTCRIERLIATGRARNRCAVTAPGLTRQCAGPRATPAAARGTARFIGLVGGAPAGSRAANEAGAARRALPSRPLRHLGRHTPAVRSRCTSHESQSAPLRCSHRRVNDVRTHHLHVLTMIGSNPRPVVVEGLDAAGDKAKGASAPGPAGLSDRHSKAPGTCPTRRAVVTTAGSCR